MADRSDAVLVTLGFLRAGDYVLLLRLSSDKDRWAGRWNGVGGHVRPGEDIREAARREIGEETGLEPSDLRLRGVLHEPGLGDRPHVLFLFTANVSEEAVQATVQVTREGTLTWFRLEEIPWDGVVPDLRALLPRLLHSDEMLFAVQEFDGSDRPVRLRVTS
jgi:8-oxo-dGTP diphosphatase